MEPWCIRKIKTKAGGRSQSRVQVLEQVIIAILLCSVDKVLGVCVSLGKQGFLGLVLHLTLSTFQPFSLVLIQLNEIILQTFYNINENIDTTIHFILFLNFVESHSFSLSLHFFPTTSLRLVYVVSFLFDFFYNFILRINKNNSISHVISSLQFFQ